MKKTNSTLTPVDVVKHFTGGQYEDLALDTLKGLRLWNQFKLSVICLFSNTFSLIVGEWLIHSLVPPSDHFLVRHFLDLMIGFISFSAILTSWTIFLYLKINPAIILIEGELRQVQKRFIKLFGVDPLRDPERAKEALIKVIFREATKANALERLSLKPPGIWNRFKDMHNCGRRFFSIQPQAEFRLKRS